MCEDVADGVVVGVGVGVGVECGGEVCCAVFTCAKDGRVPAVWKLCLLATER